MTSSKSLDSVKLKGAKRFPIISYKVLTTVSAYFWSIPSNILRLLVFNRLFFKLKSTIKNTWIIPKE